MYNTTVPQGTFYLNTNTTNTTHLSNWTFEDLKILNDAKAEALMPAMLVLGLYMIVGIIGNSVVCYIMGFKLKMNTQNMLIIYLAVFDLLNCLICMPADIHDMRHYYYFPSEVGCKIVRMFMSFNSEASILTLLVIAVDRFRKICKPMKPQMNLRHTKWFLVLVLAGAMFLSWPALVIFGFRTIQTGIPGIPGHDCSISNSLKGTLYPMVYTSILFLMFIFLCVCLIVLYSFVLSAARRHRNYMSTKSTPNHFTCPSVRGMKYSKSNHSHSATMTTEDTTSGLKSSCESLRHGDILKDHQSTDKSSTLSKMFKCTKGNGQDLSPSSGQLKKSEEQNSTKLLSIIQIGQTETDTDADTATISIINMHELDATLHQQLETQNISSDSARQGQNISLLTPNSSPNSFIRNKHSNDTNTQHRNEEPILIVSRTQNIAVQGLVRDSEDESGDIKLLNKEPGIISNNKRMSTTSKTFSQKIKQTIFRGNAGSDDETVDGEPRKRKKNSRKISKLDHKTTMIAFLVTLVFILSYMPYLSLQISKQIVEGLDYDLQGAPLVLYNIFLRSYYINSVANPIIYGFLNNRFRRQLHILLSKVCGMCCNRKQ